VNRYPITAVRRTDTAGTRAPPPALPAPPPAGARRPIIPLAVALLAVGAALGAYAIYDVASDDDDGERSAARGERPSREPVRAPPRVGSVAVGAPENGHLVRGVPFPAAGPHHFTWDPILRRSPNRRGRRYGTDRTVASVIEIAERYRRRHPRVPRVGVADLSLPRGGRFGVEYGGRGHTTHQNGLDADILYPHRDGREREAGSRGEIDRALAQALLNEFIRADAVTAIVDGALGLRGPPEVVQAMPYHETHMHVQVRRR
jgi:hypothetical protein